MNTRSDTRSKIQDVALELFGEQGYDKTSLREIAERLGVTKAALYYHFKTKEEIVSSLFQAADEGIQELIAWTKEREPTPESRRELVRLYARAMGDGRAFRLMRLIHENQHSLRELAAGMRGQERMESLAAFLTDPAAPLAAQLRARLSLGIMHFGMFALKDTDSTLDERLEAALQVAMDLIDASERDTVA
ncbi:TetR/AcrR family transcriptional regulator [Actinocrispum wychmicini]|uniref:TetR family transcriptional regulator n=1 Tax=Actinocrispum wychmicini TaxID=1213861 RepID=A0A4R2JC25_9PSEU|nr:TetR/AcrR family transcriptional regulator [Actinocrispum wychmicini]TCO57073.1 TetR family transcriptional regulator [Actinocrispum wychmicini]